MKKSLSKSISENIQTYFPYFNQTLFISQQCIDSPELNLSEESSTSSSQESHNNSTEIEEKLIPLNLLDLSPIDNPAIEIEKIDEIENISNIEKNKAKTELKKFAIPERHLDNDRNRKSQIDKIKINLDAKPYVPYKFKLYPLLLPDFQPIFLNAQKKLSSLKQKKEVKGRKGDWFCDKCHNMNFSFRKYCNKCGKRKDEKKKLFEIGDDMIQLAKISL